MAAVGTEPKRVTSMGIDVAIARGLDIVVLDDSLQVVFGPATLRLVDLPDLIRRTEPHVIAIDSPPAWGLTGKSRPIERQLQALGISIFPTPAAEFARDLHRWMETGFDVFKVAGDLGYPLHTRGASFVPPTADADIPAIASEGQCAGGGDPCPAAGASDEHVWHDRSLRLSPAS